MMESPPDESTPRAPNPENLPDPLLRAARRIAEVLQRAGHEAWLVGGCVRDLCLGREPKDVDMVTDALPERIEELFPRTLGVGKAFGTMLVHIDPGKTDGGGDRGEGTVDIEVTTYRAEEGYRDGRRPDAVTYAPSAEIDVLRRDFTCNALYLDPREGTLLDPAGGLADLERRVLRTVGDAKDRFREDGLRLWRMARFEASLDFEPAEGLHEAARSERGSLRGVSPERVNAELTRILAGPRPERGLEAVEECDLWPEGWAAWTARRSEAERRGAIRMLPRVPREARMTALLAPASCWTLSAPSEESVAEARAALEWLKPTRTELQGFDQLLAGMVELGGCLEDPRRSRRIRFLRRPDAEDLIELALASAPASPPSPAQREGIRSLRAWGSKLTREELHGAPWITSKVLLDAGIPPGQHFGRLLAEAEEGQLDGRWNTPGEALDWARQQAPGAQD